MPSAIEDRERVYTVDAFVLRRSDLGEKDRLLSLFTRQRGKVRAVARGARGSHGRLGGLTEPLTLIHAQLARGRTLEVLTQGQVRAAYLPLRRRLERVAYGLYFADVTEAAVQEAQPAEEIWDLLAASLELLADCPSPDLLARAFEMRLLVALGSGPSLEGCAVDGEAAAVAPACFHPGEGGLLCPTCLAARPGGVRLDAAALRALRALVDHPLDRVAAGKLRPERRNALAACLMPYLQQVLGAPLRSQGFLRELDPKRG